MDIYNLINSKAIQEHCRKIGHKFNTEELTVLIYRNKKMSVEDKIKAYQELIEKYEDMEVIERINCKHYDSVKDMIRGEIKRIKELSIINICRDMKEHFTKEDAEEERKCNEEIEKLEQELRDLGYTEKIYL